jgi:hypothetical protein
MSTPPDTLDRLVITYLDAVEHALTGVPEDRRRELLGDLSDHIAAERAALDVPTEAAVRAILDRLGHPVDLATEARLVEDSPVIPSATAAPAGWPGMRRLGRRGWLLAAVGLALLIFLVLGLAVVSSSGVSQSVPGVPTFPPLPPTPGSATPR